MFLEKNGYSTKRFKFETAGDFLLIKSGEKHTEKPVLMMAHMDTVHKVGDFGEEIVRYDGSWMSGRDAVGWDKRYGYFGNARYPAKLNRGT